MARKANPFRLQQVAQIIYEQPGHKSGEYARMMRTHRQTFNRLLVQLEDRGILFSEDDKGRLWPFGKSRAKR